MSKLKEQELVWVDQVAKVVKSIFEFEKKKSRISQLDLKLTLLQDLLKLMQEGGGFGLYPLPMVHDPNYKPKPYTIQCRGKSTFVVNECPICAQWFFNSDILVTSCGHMYHVSCMAYYASSHPCCKITDCKEEF
jgi:hypothetical protein